MKLLMSVFPISLKIAQETVGVKNNSPVSWKSAEKRKNPGQMTGISLAEREGFEPSMVLPIHEFQSCAINRARRSLHAGVFITPDEILLYTMSFQKSTLNLQKTEIFSKNIFLLQRTLFEPISLTIINDKQHRSERPAYRISDNDSDHFPVQRQNKEYPQNSKHTNSATG